MTLFLLVKGKTRIVNVPIETSPEAAIEKFNAKKASFAYAYIASVPGKVSQESTGNVWQCVAVCCCFVLQLIVSKKRWQCFK